MSVAARLGAFAAALVLVFGAAFAIGGAVGPVGRDDAPTEPPATPAEQPIDQHGGHP